MSNGECDVDVEHQHHVEDEVCVQCCFIENSIAKQVEEKLEESTRRGRRTIQSHKNILRLISFKFLWGPPFLVDVPDGLPIVSTIKKREELHIKRLKTDLYMNVVVLLTKQCE